MTLRELRLSLNLTQAEFVHKLSVSNTLISKIENNREKMTETVSDKIYELYGVEIEQPVKEQYKALREKNEALQKENEMLKIKINEMGMTKRYLEMAIKSAERILAKYFSGK